jgi:DNA recombination-mediator protein A
VYSSCRLGSGNNIRQPADTGRTVRRAGLRKVARGIH